MSIKHLISNKHSSYDEILSILKKASEFQHHFETSSAPRKDLEGKILATLFLNPVHEHDYPLNLQ